MIFDYNILNSYPKEKIRIANNTLIKECNEVWVFLKDFTSLTDGVLFEINLAESLGKHVKIIDISRMQDIKAHITYENKDYYGYKLLSKYYPLVYTAYSSKYFYIRMIISKFVLDYNKVPLNPFMSFDYFLAEKIKRELIYFSNSTFVAKANELWVFGPISDGVLAEIKACTIFKQTNKIF